MELTALLTRGQTSFSHTKDTAIPYSVLEEIKKAAPVKMCKVQVSIRAKANDRPSVMANRASRTRPNRQLTITTTFVHPASLARVNPNKRHSRPLDKRVKPGQSTGTGSLASRDCG